MQDPSSSFVAAYRRDVLSVLPAIPVLPQGFWWEFFARADAAGLRILEVPVSHRRRDGATRIYRLRPLPRIVLVHLAGLVRLRNELRRAPVEEARAAPPAVVKTP
jgi:hypothetical protein